MWLARVSAELGTTITSGYQLQRILSPKHPRCGSRAGQLLVLEQPVFAELVAASATGFLSDADIAGSVCGSVGLRDLDVWPPTTPWELKAHDGLRALLRIQILAEPLTCSPKVLSLARCRSGRLHSWTTQLDTTQAAAGSTTPSS